MHWRYCSLALSLEHVSFADRMHGVNCWKSLSSSLEHVTNLKCVIFFNHLGIDPCHHVKSPGLNSLWPSNAILQQEIWVNIGSNNGLLPDGTKPLPEPMLTGHQWSPVTFISGQFHKRCLNRQSLKSVWKLRIKFHSNFPGANDKYLTELVSELSICPVSKFDSLYLDIKGHASRVILTYILESSSLTKITQHSTGHSKLQVKN